MQSFALSIGDGGETGSIAGDIWLNTGTSLWVHRSNRYELASDQSVSGSGHLYQAGTGTLAILGSTTHTGGTTIQAGTLELAAGASMAGNVNVTSGNLDVAGTVTGGAQLAPGTVLTVRDGGDIAGQVTSTGGNVAVHSGGTLSNGVSLSGGILSLNGSLSGLATIASGAVLTGSGSVENVQLDGTLRPGNSPSLLTVEGDLTMGSTAVSEFEIQGDERGVTFDAVNLLGGELTYGGTLSIALLGYFPTLGETFNLFSGFGGQSGTFTAIVFNKPGYAADFDYALGDLTFTAVPEPSVFALAAAFAVGALVVIRRRR